MTAHPNDDHRLDAALQEVLEQHTDVLLAALGEDGYRIPLPPSVEELDHHGIPVPEERVTMVDVVVPADRLKVVEIWERAREARMAFGTVRTQSEPDRLMTLTIVSAHERHGVWLAALTDSDAAVPSGSTTEPDALVIPVRPRSATIYKNMTAIMTGIDANTTKMLGWSEEHMVGKRSTEFIHPDDQERAIDNWMAMLSNRGSQRVRLRHQCRYGGWLWIEVENICHDAEDPDDIVIEARISDISDEMGAHEALRFREQLFSRLAESLPTGVAQIERDGSVVFANGRLLTILDIPRAARIDDLLTSVDGDDALLVRDALAGAFDDGVDLDLEIEIHAPRDTHNRRCVISVVAVANQEGEPSALVCVNDITESARLRENLRERATFDVLTGCYNRGSVMHALDDALANGNGGDTAVMFIDLDKFKPVNDTLGHAAGDELLIHVANRLSEISRADDLVGRLGGDEFLLVCRNLADPLAQARAIADRVHFALCHPVLLAAGNVELTASIGVACAQPGSTSEALVSQADRAMYLAKHQRRGPVFADDADAREDLAD
jgi:diguanylate cyclase (GGDEF)-like protein/PAS domain S-box-containing protein